MLDAAQTQRVAGQKKVDTAKEKSENYNRINGGVVNESQNTELLEQGAVSALGGRYDSVWQQSESAKKILGYLGLVRERQAQNATDTGASDSRWLAPNAYKQQIEKGFNDGILRALRGVTLSGKEKTSDIELSDHKLNRVIVNRLYSYGIDKALAKDTADYISVVSDLITLCKKAPKRNLRSFFV